MSFSFRKSTRSSTGPKKTPGSNVAPPAKSPRADSDLTKDAEYFSLEGNKGKGGGSSTSSSSGSDASTVVSPSVTGAPKQKESGSWSGNDSGTPGGDSRKSSVASVTFRPPANPALPQGRQRPERFRSPSPQRFRHHVAFDNIPVGEATKNNALSYSLNVSHYGYHPRRRSRTVMVGVDQHVYSDFALQWLLEEYADDGDEIICVHVTDKDARTVDEKTYKARAEAMVEKIKSKIPDNCAVSIKLEYAVGKLHATFQKLIQVYQPSMLVVGTRGRSLGGFQGLVNTNSFSKYCLQYSPIPTVVVRDYEKRKKKKEKRSNDPSRHSYAAMLAANQGKHEADSDNSSVYDMEARLSPDEEAHKVAAAIGLPAAFDPTLKPINLESYLHRRTSAPNSPSPTESPKIGAIAAPLITPEVSNITTGDSDEDESGDEDEAEAEFEAIPGQQVLMGQAQQNEQEQKKRLHEMEVGEAAALKHNVDEDEDDDEDDSAGGTGGSQT